MIILPFLDKFGRRPLMIGTFAGMTVGNIVLALSYVFDISELAVVGIVVFLFMFECGTGCLFWVIASEAFPSSWREMGLSICVSANNLANIIVSFGFPVVQEYTGAAVAFFIFAGVALFGTIFLFFCLPESSGELDKKPIAVEKPEGTVLSIPGGEKPPQVEIPSLA